MVVLTWVYPTIYSKSQQFFVIISAVVIAFLISVAKKKWTKEYRYLCFTISNHILFQAKTTTWHHFCLLLYLVRATSRHGLVNTYCYILHRKNIMMLGLEQTMRKTYYSRNIHWNGNDICNFVKTAQNYLLSCFISSKVIIFISKKSFTHRDGYQVFHNLICLF